MDRSDWWTTLPGPALEALGETWIPIGAPGFAGREKARWRSLLDARFGADGWRIGHFVRGRIVPPAEAILEYEAAYQAFLRDRRPLVAFLAGTCGNVYDDEVANVFSDSYGQPATPSNHYQDVAVRRVIAALADDPAWPEVRPTEPGDADLVDLGTGRRHRVPRAYGFGGDHLLQIREPDSPGYALSPAVVPVHDPDLIATLPGRQEWYHLEGCAHLSVEAFWQMSKVIEVRYDRFLALGPGRADPLAGL
ncbi:MAG: hypothetical protein A2V84_03360 [Chloroflexi bacterium RBG_16_70_13]|nr:MAG: hypothetical protein A2V84_03360 [Chloroflexi bacterium RBG_16_70_13]